MDIAYERTLELMVAKKGEVASLAELLLAKETINHDDIVATIGHRPFKADDQYAAYISNALGIANEAAKKAAEAATPVAAPNLAPV